MDVDLMRKLARPYFVRAAVALAVALAGLVAASGSELRRRDLTSPESLIVLGGAAVLLVFGLAAARMLARGVRSAAGERLGDTRAGPLGLVIMIVGGVIVILSVLTVLGVNLSGLVLGGALTGVIVGIAAQQTLGNFFAGLVLLLVRPFSLGELIILKSGPLGGEYEGVVSDMGLFYVTLDTGTGPVQLPNAGVLAAAIGPGARSSSGEPEMEDDPGTAQGGTA